MTRVGVVRTALADPPIAELPRRGYLVRKAIPS